MLLPKSRDHAIARRAYSTSGLPSLLTPGSLSSHDCYWPARRTVRCTYEASMKHCFMNGTCTDGVLNSCRPGLGLHDAVTIGLHPLFTCTHPGSLPPTRRLLGTGWRGNDRR